MLSAWWVPSPVRASHLMMIGLREIVRVRHTFCWDYGTYMPRNKKLKLELLHGYMYKFKYGLVSGQVAWL